MSEENTPEVAPETQPEISQEVPQEAPQASEAPLEGETPQETQARILQRKFKVGEKEIDFELDLDNIESNEELFTMIQKGLGADHNFQEAARIRKEAEAIEKQLAEKDSILGQYKEKEEAFNIAKELFDANDIGAYAQVLGIDPMDLIEQYVERVQTEQAKSPELKAYEKAQRENAEKDKQLAEYKAKMEAIEAEKKRQADEIAFQNNNNMWNDTIDAMLQKYNLPDDDDNVFRGAMYQQIINLASDPERSNTVTHKSVVEALLDVSAKQLSENYNNRFQNRVKSEADKLAELLEIEQLEKLLASKKAAAQTQEVPKKTVPQGPNSVKESGQIPEKKSDYVPMDERKSFDEIFGTF